MVANVAMMAFGETTGYLVMAKKKCMEMADYGNIKDSAASYKASLLKTSHKYFDNYIVT